MRTILPFVVIAALGMTPAVAATITVAPGDAPVAVSPVFGPVAQVAGPACIGYGIDFSWGGDEGVFNDPPSHGAA